MARSGPVCHELLYTTTSHDLLSVGELSQELLTAYMDKCGQNLLRPKEWTKVMSLETS